MLSMYRNGDRKIDREGERDSEQVRERENQYNYGHWLTATTQPNTLTYIFLRFYMRTERAVGFQYMNLFY